MSVVRLRTFRTVTVSCDLAFRRRALTILEPLGPTAFAICSLERREEVLELLAGQDATVAVLDVTLAPHRLVELVSALARRAPYLGIVAVTDVEPAVELGLPVVVKWGWASDLTNAVQAAARTGNPLRPQAIVHAGEQR